MSKKVLTCKDYYGDSIEIGDLVALVSEPTKGGKVIAINQVNDKNLLVIENRYGYTNNADPKDYYIDNLVTKETIIRHAKKWVEEDMKNKKHIYIPYKDAGGIPIAEGMVLTPGFYGMRELWYYVAKNKETEEYYLQCFLDLEDMDTKVLEITEKIEKASEYLVAIRANGIPMFNKEDYGFNTLEDLKKILKV